MKFKIEKIDVVLISVLLSLIAMEFFLKKHELSHVQVLLGVIIGFSVGFKLSAVHGSTVSREAITLAKKKDKLLSFSEDERAKLVQGYDLDLARKEKLIATLRANLADRDGEIRDLVIKLQELRGRIT